MANNNAIDASTPFVPAKGGTGVANNNSSTLTISGNFGTTLTVTGATSVTLPTSGTLSTTTGTVTSVAGAGLASGTVTSTGNITVTAASQSDQESGSSNTVAVTPGVQQFHQSAAKMRINCDSAGSIFSSYNVTSITDTGTGTITVTIATDFSGTDYSVVGDCLYSALVRVRSVQVNSALTAGAFLANCVDETANNADPANWFFVAYGDQ